MNDWSDDYYKSPRSASLHNTCTFTYQRKHAYSQSCIFFRRFSFPYDVHAVIFLNIMFLTILGEAGGMHDYIRDGRHASNPLHGNKYNALRVRML